MGDYYYGTWRQTKLRFQLAAIEFYLDSKPNDAWLTKRRHDIIEELNRVQLEEWNYD